MNRIQIVNHIYATRDILMHFLLQRFDIRSCDDNVFLQISQDISPSFYHLAYVYQCYVLWSSAFFLILLTQEQVISTYVYSQKHNYIPYSTFTITTVQLHVSAINVGHLQVVHEAPYDKLYLHVSGGTVCGVGWVRDLVLCLQKGCGSGLFRGAVKISFMSTTSINYIYRLHF